ncbi:hypothetical protein C5S25_13865 [Clostridium perfringens]
MQKFIQTYIIFKERVILRIVKLFFHNNLTDSFNFIFFKNINFIMLFLFKFELLGIEMPRFLGNTPNGVRLTKLTRAFRPPWIPIV